MRFLYMCCKFFLSFKYQKQISITQIFLKTLKGGLKAVVWTDVVQTFSMFGALILVAVKGTIDLKEGGADFVFSEAYKTSRIERPM